ncbi:hypothetical protein DFH09DRAFT_1305304 [Mycena vulgaris]|nr:hypothetical protein DFH09DRAFT_1305304 [Mycena vulgaris]
MKPIGGLKLKRPSQNRPSTSRLAPSVPRFNVTFHIDDTSKSEERYVANTGLPPESIPNALPTDDSEPVLLFLDARDDTPGSISAYETTPACDEEGDEKTSKIRQNVAPINELRAEEPAFLEILLSLHYHSQLLTPCGCGKVTRLRTVACTECLQAELLCPQCWLNKHRTMPTHWAFVWKQDEGFFEKYDFCRVMKNTVIGLGHYGERCPEADPGWSFTLVDTNGIHATAISFCRCQKTPDGRRGESEFKQLLRAGIFPGSIKEPKTGYTLGLLHYYRQQRSQGKGSAYNFVLVLQRMADPFFAGAVPDIYNNFLAISRFHKYLQITLECGQAHDLDIPLPGEEDRPYPNRPKGYRGVNCAACPERGVNMPLVVNSPRYLRHTISHNLTLDGNFKANLFFKRDNGSDTALTDGSMYFPTQAEFDGIAKTYVVPDEDKAHIGSIRHQGQVKYGNTAVSGVVCCACDHAVAGSFVDMLKGEVFAIGTYAQREHLRHVNSPPHGPESATPTTFSYDSFCSFVVNMVKRAITLFPEEEWLHTLLDAVEGQIPADHINGHGPDCQAIWQAVYFACRGHFHGETAEVIWAFLNPIGSSTRQMTGAARHNIINFIMHAWNKLKVLRQAELLAAERADALQLFELHMAVVEDLSRQHRTEVHEATKVLTVESVLATMITAEQQKSNHNDAHDAGTPVAQWIYDGMRIEHEQLLVIALLQNHREHPLKDTWATITKLRDNLNLNLKKFRQCQREIYPRLQLSALDVDEPELTAIAVEPYPPLSYRDTRRKETHLHRAKGDSRLFDGTAWYLQSGTTISSEAVASRVQVEQGSGDEEPQLRLVAGTQTLKRTSFKHGQRTPKRLKDIAPDDVVVTSSASEAEDSDAEMSLPAELGQRQAKDRKKKKSNKKADGWIWMENMMRGQELSDAKLAEYKKEIQWFRAEAEMYRWLEQYERKHAEFYRVIKRFRRDSVVWAGLANREEVRNGGVNGAVTFARMQAAMHKRLEHNARVTFKDPESGAHHDWVSATNFDELVKKIDKWRDILFKWMDEMNIYRAYKDF